MNLVNPAKSIRIAIVIEAPAGLHPLMPTAYIALHRLKGKLKTHAAQVFPHMLRHPVVDFIDLAHALSPVRQVLEGEGEGEEKSVHHQPRFPWESEGVEGLAHAQPFAFGESGESPAHHQPRFPWEGEGSEDIATAQPLILEGEDPAHFHGEVGENAALFQAQDLESEAEPRFAWEKVAPLRNHSEDSEGEGVEGEAPSHTSQSIVHGRITHGVDGMVVAVGDFIDPIAFLVALELFQGELREG